MPTEANGIKLKLNYEAPTYCNYDCAFWEFWGDRFDTKELAEQKVSELMVQDKARKIQLLECIEV